MSKRDELLQDIWNAEKALVDFDNRKPREWMVILSDTPYKEIAIYEMCKPFSKDSNPIHVREVMDDECEYEYCCDVRKNNGYIYVHSLPVGTKLYRKVE